MKKKTALIAVVGALFPIVASAASISPDSLFCRQKDYSTGHFGLSKHAGEYIVDADLYNSQTGKSENLIFTISEDSCSFDGKLLGVLNCKTVGPLQVTRREYWGKSESFTASRIEIEVRREQLDHWGALKPFRKVKLDYQDAKGSEGHLTYQFGLYEESEHYVRCYQNEQLILD